MLTDMDGRIWFLSIVLISGSYAMTRQQLKNSGKMFKKNCMAKNQVTEDLAIRLRMSDHIIPVIQVEKPDGNLAFGAKRITIAWLGTDQLYAASCNMLHSEHSSNQIGSIEKGKFVEEKPVMCYIACVYQMMQIVKNNKLNYEATIKQVDMMYPNELKDSFKKSIEKCKTVSDKYKDLCEASYWTAKCLYEDNPKDFIFA